MAIYFTYDNVYVSLLLPPFVSPSPSSSIVSTTLLSVSCLHNYLTNGFTFFGEAFFEVLSSFYNQVLIFLLLNFTSFYVCFFILIIVDDSALSDMSFGKIFTQSVVSSPSTETFFNRINVYNFNEI